MRARVALIVDHPFRDLSGLILTAFALAQQGVKSFLVPMNIQEREIWPLAPDFVLLNYIRLNIEIFVRKLLKAGIRFGVLDTEGGFFGDLKAYSDVLSRDKSLLENVECMCVWGPIMSNFLMEQGFFSERQMVVTGLPRYDFYCAPWKKVPQALLPPEMKDAGQMVLINTKVAIANPQFTTPEQDLETYVNVLGMDRAVALHHMRIGAQAVEAVIELARRLARDFPETHFVLRPHPHERIETYAERFDRDFSNLEARKEGTVDGWVLRASALIHRHCSTAIEAGLAGVPALAPQWIPSSQNAPDTETVSVQCGSYAELQDILQSVRSGQFVIPSMIQSRLDDIIHRWLYRMDGFAHIRVSQAILASLPDRREVDISICRSFFYNFDVMPTAWSGYHLAQHAKWAMKLSPNWSFKRFKQIPVEAWLPPQGKSFTCQQVQQYVDQIQEVAAQNNVAFRPVKASWARERGEYLGKYMGHSIVMYPE